MGINVNVVDFGADSTGVSDSAPAFEAAIASFSSADISDAGTVKVPPGVYRLAKSVGIKKSVWIRGSQGRSFFRGCQIKPDPGITAFVMEGINTPAPPPNAGRGDGAQISNLTIYNPGHKVGLWQAGSTYSVGQRIKVGPPPKQGAILLGENWYRHYECTVGGRAADSDIGPRSLGNDKILNYDDQMVNFAVGQYVTGQTSGAAGVIIADTDSGDTGQLRLTSVTGTFQDDENLLNALVYAVANGPSTVVGTDTILNYHAQKVNFIIGQRVTGQKSKAVGVIIADTDSGDTGQLRLSSQSGTFEDEEDLKVVCAVANGPSTAAIDDEADGTARWKYIGAGAGIRIRANGCTVRDVTIHEMSGSGIQIVAQDPEVPDAGANANSWMLRNVDIFTCDGHGLHVNGSDTNGGAFFGGVLMGNGGPASDEDFTGPGFNIFDSSFLGNTYCQVQMGSGGQGSFFTDSTGGGCTFVGCYQEGSGGGVNIATNSCTIVGGGLSASPVLGSGSPTWYGGAATVIGPGKSFGFQAQIRGWSGPAWRPNVYVPLGYRRENPYPNGNVYEVIKPGTTALAGGPTGTDPNITIVDGTAEWKFVHKETVDGQITLGSKEPQYKAFFTTTAPDDAGGVGLSTYFRHDDFAGVTGAQGFMYGISGAGGESGTGMMHAVNDTTLVEWPMHVPAGRALFEYLWIGGCRVAFGTGEPTAGTWNKGDRIYNKGSAVSPGGAEGLICTGEGTAGSYSGGRTATADGTAIVRLSGNAMSSLYDQKDFKVGNVLTINGVTARVVTVSADGLALTLNAAIPAGSGLSIAFRGPTFKDFGRIATTESMNLTLSPLSLTNVDDAAGRWQFEGGEVFQGNSQIANYASTKRVVIKGTEAQNTAMLTLTLFFLGQAQQPPENMTLQGSHDFGSGDERGSVSATSSAFTAYVAKQFKRSGNALVIQ